MTRLLFAVAIALPLFSAAGCASPQADQGTGVNGRAQQDGGGGARGDVGPRDAAAQSTDPETTEEVIESTDPT